MIRLPFHRMLNLVYVWCLGRIEHKDHEAFKQSLLEPLDPANPSESDMEAEGELFMKNLGALGGGV